MKYSPKTCKYNLVPGNLDSRAYTTYTGEVQVNDVFGIPSVIKKHIMLVRVKAPSLFTMQAEIHRDTPVTLSIDVFEGKEPADDLSTEKTLGAGGEDTKVFIHGTVATDGEQVVKVGFEMTPLELAASQVDSRVAEAKCWPIRIDLAIIPHTRAPMHWPDHCVEQTKNPPPIGQNSFWLLDDNGKVLSPNVPPLGDGHYVYRMSKERHFAGFGRALWSGVVEVPPRMHRFVRLFFRASFRFASNPLQLVVELFDLQDKPDPTEAAPKCPLGCLGGVPVFNGQIIDHAMPTGFRYKIWLLRASMTEWTSHRLMPSGRHCIEYDFDYSIKFEQGMTPFEIGPSAWLCESTRLPASIIQTADTNKHSELGDGEAIIGRNIWIRDRFGFPPDEVTNMEHVVTLEVAERSMFRATTHHSDGVDVFIKLRAPEKENKLKNLACRPVKHPGPVPRQTIFCVLSPGTYKLTFFADYPLGGLHPCSDFFAQMAIKPLVLLSDVDKCMLEAGPKSTLTISPNPVKTLRPVWQTLKVPIEVSLMSKVTQVWRESIEVTEETAAQKVFLRLVVYSDYASADMRFQVWLDGKWIADTQVTASGYADMIGPLDVGVYEIRLYYISAGNSAGEVEPVKLCSSVSADLRIFSKSAFGNSTENWMCSSTRVPAPHRLEPQPSEQVLIDSEYVMPSTGAHVIRIVLSETRLLRVQSTSASGDFRMALRSGVGKDKVDVARGKEKLEIILAAGSYTLILAAMVEDVDSAATCPVFFLNLLLQAHNSIPMCPWGYSYNGPRSSHDDMQKRASDHIGELLLNLVPTELSQDAAMNVKEPVSLWMSEGMSKDFEFKVSSTAAIRLDIAMHPPFLPLQAFIRNKFPKTKLEAPVATAEWTENRLLLLDSDLPAGQYILSIAQPRAYKKGPGVSVDMRTICSHVTISAELGPASKEAINNMRSELLDLPDLLAIQPWLPSLNMVGWLSAGSSTAPVVGTQVYRFSKDGSTTKFTLDEPSLVRVVCEPADLSNADIDAKLISTAGGTRRTVATSDKLGQVIAEADAGPYELEMHPKANAPFLVTVGVATKGRLKEDIVFNANQDICAQQVPDLSAGLQFPASGWTLGPVFMRLDKKFLMAENVIPKVPIVIKVPSVLYIEVGSSLPLDLVRISLEVPEGLWVAEQRGLRNSLEIELPAGQYTIHLGQPKVAPVPSIQRCLDFSVYVVARPMNPDAAAEEKDDEDEEEGFGRKQFMEAEDGEDVKAELNAREEAAVESAPCFSMGTAPMPLDLSDPKGGSAVLGGPIKDGRLLVRAKVMITDMHDGRKKVYMSTGGKTLQVKVGVLLGGYSKLSLASALSFSVISSSGQIVPTLMDWSTPGGWERIVILDGSAPGYWLRFHHDHRERAESACMHFTLAIEAHPKDEVRSMMTCPSTTFRADVRIPSQFTLKEETRQAATLSSKSGEQEEYAGLTHDSMQVAGAKAWQKPYRFKSPMWSCKQPQDGFLTKSKFTLNQWSWVSVEVAYNFFVSHAELDLCDANDMSEPIAFGELDFVHSGGHMLNARLMLGRVLAPGDYIVRVADDHYAKQVDGGDACFPFSFEFIAIPESSDPTVVSVQPDPTVPVRRGTDLVVTLRFSEPPYGTVEEVVSSFWLGLYQAKTGGSFHHMHSKYLNAKHTTTVQASAAEGHHVWVIAWSAEVLEELEENYVTLSIVGLKSNITKKRFRFNSPTFTISEPGHVEPWSGGEKMGAGEPEQKKGPGGPKASDTLPGVFSDEKGGSGSSGTVGTVGAPKPEGSSPGSIFGSFGLGGSTPKEQSPSPPPRGQDVPVSVSHWEPKPNVEEWNPLGDDHQGLQDHDSPATPAKKDEDGCPEGTVLNKETSICETAGVASSVLSITRLHYVAFLFSAVFIAVFCWPSIRKWVPSMTAPKMTTPKTRFRDIGERSEAEELGLVGNQDYDDDDML